MHPTRRSGLLLELESLKTWRYDQLTTVYYG